MLFNFIHTQTLIFIIDVCVYHMAGSSFTTNTIATDNTSILFTSERTGSGFIFGDTTSIPDSITTSPVTETIGQSMFWEQVVHALNYSIQQNL